MRTLYFWPVVSTIFLLSFLSSPNLSRCRLNVYHTSTHGVDLCEFRMQVWNVLQAARSRYRTQKFAKNSPFAHPCTTVSGHIFATKAGMDNRKNLLNSNISSTCPPQYGELRPTNSWDRFVSLGHPSNFNGFRVLPALLHGTLVGGVSQALRRLTAGAIYIRQGGHHVGHRPTF